MPEGILSVPGAVDIASIPAPRQRRRKGAVAPTAVGQAAIYVRVSTDEQTEGGSLASQELACRAECAKRGLEVAAVYRDEGWSGGKLERPALTELRAAVAAGEVAAVVIYAVDRLSRRQADTLTLLEEFAAAGVGIASASQPFDTTTPMGRAMIGFLGIFAELQRDEIRSRTRVALQKKIAAGEACGRTPYGCTIVVSGDQKRYAADPETWPTVERILAERSSGASCQRIADKLNRDGVLTPTGQRRGEPAGQWSAATVAALCRSRAVREVARGS